MSGKTVRKLKAMAREVSRDSPELFDFYYKQAKRIYKMKSLRRV